jgi:SLT domain-containing protein
LYPALYRIAECESEGQHYEADGVTVKYNRAGSSAKGLMQIMYSIHNQKALSLGFDILTPHGNAMYANYLYDTEGFSPWRASAYCHGLYS